MDDEPGPSNKDQAAWCLAHRHQLPQLSFSPSPAQPAQPSPAQPAQPSPGVLVPRPRSRRQAWEQADNQREE